MPEYLIRWKAKDNRDWQTLKDCPEYCQKLEILNIVLFTLGTFRLISLLLQFLLPINHTLSVHTHV